MGAAHGLDNVGTGVLPGFTSHSSADLAPVSSHLLCLFGLPRGLFFHLHPKHLSPRYVIKRKAIGAKGFLAYLLLLLEVKGGETSLSRFLHPWRPETAVLNQLLQALFISDVQKCVQGQETMTICRSLAITHKQIRN